MSEQERNLRKIPGQQHHTSSTIRVFATTNLKLFALVDLSELDTPEAIRKALCFSLNISDWDNAAIYHTEVGQTEHGIYDH